MHKKTEAFAAKVLLSIQQARGGEFARVHTPKDIAAYKARGRPVGSTKPDAKSSAQEREALLRKALSFRMTRPYGKKFERGDAYGL